MSCEESVALQLGDDTTALKTLDLKCNFRDSGGALQIKLPQSISLEEVRLRTNGTPGLDFSEEAALDISLPVYAFKATAIEWPSLSEHALQEKLKPGGLRWEQAAGRVWMLHGMAQPEARVPCSCDFCKKMRRLDKECGAF